MAENTQYQRVKEITEKLEAGIQELFHSEKYRDWLVTMSRFHNYSLNNTILIAQQKPDATLVAGYTAWQRNFRRQVSKNEKAIKILAPAPYKKRSETDKTDPVTGEILFNPDGTAQKETKEVLMPAFKIVSVFDISQTEGQDLPSLGVSELTGDVAQYELFYQALAKSTPVPIGFEDIPGDTKGYFHYADNRIALRNGMSQVQTVKTLIHEMAHQRLHAIDPNRQDPVQKTLTRNAKEVEAESVAFTICQHFGIDTSDYSFAYIAGWSEGKDTPELKASMDRIRRTASAMITEIDGHFQALQQEYALAHPTFADITDIQLESSSFESGNAAYTFSCRIHGDSRMLTYETDLSPDGGDASIHSDGNDVWHSMAPSELYTLRATLDGAVEMHRWEQDIQNAATIDDIAEVGSSLLDSTLNPMTPDQRGAVWEAIAAKERELKGVSRDLAEMGLTDLTEKRPPILDTLREVQEKVKAAFPKRNHKPKEVCR